MNDHPSEALGPKAYWNPYAAGVALGLVLLLTFVLMGYGLGSSSAATRLAYTAAHLVAPSWAETNGYVAPYVTRGNPMEDWMIFEVIGVFLGGLIGAYAGRRLQPGTVERGPRMSVAGRIGLAIAGGMVMGFAARLARGCTSGQALSGGAQMSLGSWIYMFAVFAGAYAFAPLVRREWR